MGVNTTNLVTLPELEGKRINKMVRVDTLYGVNEDQVCQR